MRRFTGWHRVLLAACVFFTVCGLNAYAQGPLTVTSISPASGVIGSTVVIAGLNFGTAQGSSSVALNGAAASVLAWSDTSITVLVPSAATSGPFSVSVNSETATSPAFTITPLPSGWSDSDIGSVGLAGSAAYANGTFTVQGAGSWSWVASDALHFVYQPLSGDGTIVARVAGVQGSGAEVGVVIRETLSPTDLYAATALDYDLYFFYRTSTGGSVSDQCLPYPYYCSTVPMPYWMKLVRSGSTFTSYASPDGVNWTQIGSSQTISMATSVYMGLGVSSNSTSSLATATFDNVSISTPSVAAPVINSLSATTGPAGTPVVISGTGFGSAQSGSVATLSGTPLPVASWSSTSISVTIPQGATTGPILVSVAPSMNDSNYVTFTMTSQPLPTGWLDADVGVVGLAGSATYASGTFTVQGAGASGLGWSNADALHFVYQPLSGDGTIIARVVSLQGGGGPEAGVAIRETLNPAATEAVTARNYDMYFFQRTTTGGSPTYQCLPYPSYCSAVPLPYWVMAVRSGSTFTGYASPDGVNWTQMGSQTITMATNVYVGLGVSSNSASSLDTATFDNVSISTPSAPAPIIASLSATTGPAGSQVAIFGSGFGASQNGSVVTLSGAPVTVNNWSDTAISVTIPSGATSGPMLVSVAPSMNDTNYIIFTITSQPLPPGWLDTDIGTVGLAGSATHANGTYTVNGAGAGIFYDTSDGLHFVYQPLSGDGTIIARVVSRSNGSTDAGVMIRETLSESSTFAGTVASGGSTSAPDFDFVYRTTTGGSSTDQCFVPLYYCSTVPLPYWVKLVRSGNTFSSYASQDGVNWTQIGSSQTITMATNVYVGLAVDNNSTSSLATDTFDNVSVSTSASPAPVITSLSATTGSVGTPVTITGSGFGTSQNGSVVTLSGAALPVTSWSATSISVAIPTGATTGPLLVSVAPTMNDSNYVIFTVTSQPLPTGWLDADIGSVGAAGSATFANGTFTVNGAGSWPLQSVPDAMHFVYQPLSGDGMIVARIVSRTNTSTEAGVLIRETLQANSTEAAVLIQAGTTGSPYFDFAYRTTTGSATTFQNISPQSLPYWLEVVRSSNVFSAYASPDGVNWTQIGTSQTITMATNVYIGLGESSDNDPTLAPATFDNVTVTSGQTLPTVTGVSPSAGPASASVTVYGGSFGAPQGTSTLTFNGAPPASITSWSDNEIVATVPSTVRTGPVVVTVNSVPSNSNVIFTAYNPTITSLAPPAAPVAGQVAISGYGFGAWQSTVSVGGLQASILSWSDTSITFVVPQNATSGPVAVTMNGYTSNTAQLTVIEPLSITGISPTAGNIGSQVGISGAGFGPARSDSVVTFDGLAATSITSWNDTQIVAVIPQGATTGVVTVQVAGTTAYGPTFQVSSGVTVTDSLGNQSSYAAIIAGGNWYISSAQGSGCSSCSIRGNNTYQFDANGNRLSATDELGRTTSYTYDSSNNMTQVTQPAVSGGTPTTAYTYNSFGEVLAMTDPLGHVTTNTYDSHGNLLTVTTPAPNGNTAAGVTQFAYNSLGELTQITDPLGHVTNIAYNSVGLIASITDPQNNITSYGYDSRGNRTSVTDALSHVTSFAYDSGNRLTQITYPDSTTANFTYDYRGRRITATDQNGKTTTYAYDDADRLTSVTDAASNVTSYAYDTENNLLGITDANGHTTNFAYDAFGRVTQTTLPSNLFETYAYDAANNLTSKTDRKNQTIQYVYDALNRLTQKSYPDSTSVEYTYDLVGKVLQVNDPTGTYGFSYDNMGRLIGTSTQYSFLTGTFTNSYSYDGASNRTGYTAPDGSTNTYSYDNLNRLTTLANSWAGSFGFSYDALSRRTQMTRPNGVATNYTYDNLSRLLSVLHQLSGSTIDGAVYTVDAAGNRTSKADQLAGVTSNYSYDAIYELTQVTQGSTTTENYRYDPVGNRLSSLSVSPYQYNPSNELVSTPNALYVYDNDGNLSSKTDSTGTTNYAWDFENRLTSVTLPGTGGTVSFAYDPFGRRIKKVTPTATSVFAYDGDNIVEETNSSGTAVARYSQELDIDEPLAMLRSGATSYYQADGLGSITSLSSAAGSLAQTYTFDSFGKQTGSSGSLTNPFQYTGREPDSETGLYFYRARYYDSTTGRFLSEDPANLAVSVNFYSYVGNNAVDFGDAYGLQGGPWHPPVGFPTACDEDKDDCATIKGKMWVLQRMIASHTGWDRTMPSPRGGNKHADDIAALWKQYADCLALYLEKCKDCDKKKDPWRPPPIPVVGPIIDRGIDAVSDWLNGVLDGIRHWTPPPPRPIWGPLPPYPYPMPVPVLP